MQNKVLIYPLSTKRILTISGVDAKNFLHRLSTQDIISLQDKESCVNLFCNSKGHLFDLVHHIQFTSQSCILISSHKDGIVLKNWLEQFLFSEDMHIEETSSWEAAFIFSETAIHTIDNSSVRIFASPIWPQMNVYLVLNSRQIVMPAEAGIAMNANSSDDASLRWHDMALGSHFCGINKEIIDDKAFEIMRIQSGLGFGSGELNEQFNPIELGLDAFVNLNKGCYVGQEVVAKMVHLNKCSRRLTELFCPNQQAHEELKESRLFNLAHEEIGAFSSISPIHENNRACALTVLKTRHLNANSSHVLAKAFNTEDFFPLHF